MYTAVLLFGSVIPSIISEPKPIMLDIYTQTSAGQEVKCETIPAGLQNVNKGRIIQINIQTRSKLINFWCTNSKGETIYDHPNIQFIQSYGILQHWKLDGTTVFSKECMQSSWTCYYQILKPENKRIIARYPRKETKEYIQGSCIVQFNITGSNSTRENSTEPFEYSAEHTDIDNSWIIGWTLGAALLLLVILIIVIINYRRKEKRLEERENELCRIRDRAPERMPPEVVYDYVYHHGAGLLRKAEAKRPVLHTAYINRLTISDH